MEQQQELGAQALLQLGNKESEQEGSGGQTGGNDATNHEDGAKDTSDAVEAAVMRYVGGTLEPGQTPGKAKRTNDDLMTDYQWSGFLEDDLQQHGTDDFQFHQQQSGNKKRKKIVARPTATATATATSHLNVDPELAQLDTASEHDKLVQAAILDARELANQLNDEIPDNEYLTRQKGEMGQGHGHGHGHGVVSNGAPTTNDIATLVAEAAARFGSWVPKTQKHGRMFSQEETDAIDKFIIAYCEINGMDRRQICERVWSNERKKDDFWESLQKVLPHRSRASVYKHVRRSYHVFDVRGKWNKDDDVLLSNLFHEHDGQWKIIGEKMQRMPEDCRDRWRNYVKCGDQRAQNKWNEYEEEKLKAIINDMLNDTTQQPIINWTVVSEKMDNTRSRIQCRYKWNKILKREATARAATIGPEDRIWLLERIKQTGYANYEDIDWDGIAAIHDKNYWNGTDFKICFEKMRSSIREFKKKSMEEILSILLQDLYNDMQRMNNHHHHQMQNHLPSEEKKFDDNTSIASAAVAAANNQQVASADEYNLWR